MANSSNRQRTNKEILARNIKANMNKLGVNAVTVCSALGIKQNTFSDWCNAKIYPRIGNIESLAKYFGIPKSALIEEQNCCQTKYSTVTFAQRLKGLREQKRETQQDIANLLGVTKHAVSGYERGVRRPAGESAFEAYELLADHFNVDVNYLLGVETANAPEFTHEEIELVMAYRKLDPQLQAAIKTLIIRTART